MAMTSLRAMQRTFYVCPETGGHRDLVTGMNLRKLGQLIAAKQIAASGKLHSFLMEGSRCFRDHDIWNFWWEWQPWVF